MLLAALDERIVEHVPTARDRALGPVEHGEDGPGNVQAALAQPGDQVP
jgi:hypothetical protein